MTYYDFCVRELLVCPPRRACKTALDSDRTDTDARNCRARSVGQHACTSTTSLQFQSIPETHRLPRPRSRRRALQRRQTQEHYHTPRSVCQFGISMSHGADFETTGNLRTCTKNPCSYRQICSGKKDLNQKSYGTTIELPTNQ